MSNLDIQPAYVPPGYKLRSRVEGQAAGGFAGALEQVTSIYTVGSTVDDWSLGLHLHVSASSDATLVGIAGRAGVPVQLASTARGTYYDGMWNVGQGREQADVPGASLYWDTTAAHSLVVDSDDGRRIAVSAGKAQISADELVRIADSLPL